MHGGCIAALGNPGEAFDAVIGLKQEMWVIYGLLPSDSPRPPPENLEARAEREREAAVADNTCRLGMEASTRFDMIAQAEEQRFVGENRMKPDSLVEYFAVNPG